MGVYVFRSIHGDYVKVGHHKGDDAWERVAFRGFHSCVVPRELGDRVNRGDLELLAWYPRLTRKDERTVHRAFQVGAVGEWHCSADSEAILALARTLNGNSESEHESCDLDRVVTRGRNWRTMTRKRAGFTRNTAERPPAPSR